MARQGQRGGPSEERFVWNDYTDAEVVKAELEVLGLT